jgi:hypothetical protein
VADVISLDKKLKLQLAEKEALVKKRKIQAVQKVFQCTHCHFKCVKCGAQLEADAAQEANRPHQRMPYRFCSGCLEEYTDYIERLKGRGDPDCYWRNAMWMDLWRAWIDYQNSMDQYMKSKEFVQLMQDLKQSRPED